jgi:hypothetical protein
MLSALDSHPLSGTRRIPLACLGYKNTAVGKPQSHGDEKGRREKVK